MKNGSLGTVERIEGSSLTVRLDGADRREVRFDLGVVAGIIVWVCFSGPIARGLPAGWSVPERMAAATLRLDRWAAGIQLLK